MSTHTPDSDETDDGVSGPSGPDEATAIDKSEALDSFYDPRRNTYQALESPNPNQHHDERSIREVYGYPRYDRAAFNWPSVLPDMLEHDWDPDVDMSGGGTDALVRGKPGTGKSTLGCYMAERTMEINDEKVVWRGSSSRSEWLPLAPWTRLCLPEGCDFQIALQSKDPTDPQIELELDELTEIVRDVVFYSDPVQLNHELLEQGQFHVVYPDPRMNGCQEVLDNSAERSYDPPSSDRPLFHHDDPAVHWWFGWALARVEHGPHDFTTWIMDEMGDLCPQNARNDSFGTFQKVEMLKDAWVDMRKLGLSVYGFVHAETELHSMIRRKIRWRIQMSGTANPTGPGSTVGFDTVPMRVDQTSRENTGTALAYTETNFEKFRWSDMQQPNDWKLKITPEEA